jgi:hypothetical protein
MEKKHIGRPRRVKKDPDTCGGPLMEKCERCNNEIKCLPPYFTRNLRSQKATYGPIASMVIAFYLPKVKPTAWKLYTYLNDRAVRDPKSKDYGTCWAGLDQISKGTGISKKHIYLHAKHLEELGLIARRINTYGNRRDGFKKSIQYVLRWYNREPELAALVKGLGGYTPKKQNPKNGV